MRAFLPMPGMRVLVNPATGEELTVLRADAGAVEFEALWPRPGRRAAMHRHPGMQERFTVLDGVVGLRSGGEDEVLRPGDVRLVGRDVGHEAWNAGEGPARLRLELAPALRWLEFTERLFALMADPDALRDGRALQALLAEFPEEIAL